MGVCGRGADYFHILSSLTKFDIFEYRRGTRIFAESLGVIQFCRKFRGYPNLLEWKKRKTTTVQGFTQNWILTCPVSSKHSWLEEKVPTLSFYRKWFSYSYNCVGGATFQLTYDLHCMCTWFRGRLTRAF